jgi:hypothetical protein
MRHTSMDAALEDEVAVVSHALPKWYALGHAWRRDVCLGPRDWRRLCALSLSAIYSVLLVLASLCVATGLFHAAAPHDTHHHHADSAAAHHHAAPDAPPAAPVPDICDIVHQVCTTLVLWTVPLPTLTLSSGPAPGQTVCSCVDSLLPAPRSIRAPPVVIS